VELGAVGDLAKAVNYSANTIGQLKPSAAEMTSFKPSTAHQCSRILGGMRISGAFLAEKTDAVDNKLNVRGGVISKYTVGRDRVAQFDLVVLTQGDAGGSDRLVVVEVSPPNGGEPLEVSPS
jgi:hypothetical protein